MKTDDEVSKSTPLKLLLYFYFIPPILAVDQLSIQSHHQ